MIRVWNTIKHILIFEMRYVESYLINIKQSKNDFSLSIS